MRKRDCCLCGKLIPNRSITELIMLGYSAFQLGNKKKEYFCQNHKTKEKSDYMSKKMKGEEMRC